MTNKKHLNFQYLISSIVFYFLVFIVFFLFTYNSSFQQNLYGTKTLMNVRNTTYIIFEKKNNEKDVSYKNRKLCLLKLSLNELYYIK